MRCRVCPTLVVCLDDVLRFALRIRPVKMAPIHRQCVWQALDRLRLRPQPTYTRPNRWRAMLPFRKLLRHEARAPRRLTLSLALQGGGAHGAFTWGVLDRLLEDERLEITGSLWWWHHAMRRAAVRTADPAHRVGHRPTLGAARLCDRVRRLPQGGPGGDGGYPYRSRPGGMTRQTSHSDVSSEGICRTN